MAELVSPGVDITVIDESQYAPSGAATVPLLFVVSDQDKIAPNGNVAPGTEKDNANSLYVLTGQRDVVTNFGSPLFYTSNNSSPIYGYELNEYGLMATYSLLGVSNKAYVVRADIDLSQLASSAVRPLAKPADGAFWLDIAASRWGIFEWDVATQSFVPVVPLVITDPDDLAGVGTAPKPSLGNRGSYAVNAYNSANPVYYKNRSNVWVLVGSEDWMESWPTIQSGTTSPALNIGDSIVINGEIVTFSGTTVSAVASDINSATITGVTAAAVAGKLEIYANATATPDGSTQFGAITIANDSGSGLTDLSITAKTYYRPALQVSKHTSVPLWKSTDSAPRPEGSIWVKSTAANFGANLAIKRWNELTNSWRLLSAPIYTSELDAIAEYDPLRGGAGIPTNSIYVLADKDENDTLTYQVLYRLSAGATIITGLDRTPAFTIGDSFVITESVVSEGVVLEQEYTVTMTGTNADSFVEDVLALGASYISARVNADGTVSLIHLSGGYLKLEDPDQLLEDGAGIYLDVKSPYLRSGPSGSNSLIGSNWVTREYTASDVAPGLDPANKTMWYWGALGEADIMIHDGTTWKGYRNVSNDARGFNLSNTDPKGPIWSATEPTAQSDETALSYGDLWIDTSDLENFPLIYRWSVDAGENKWVLIDNADQTTENGIVFADARFMGTENGNIVSGDIPTIETLLTNNYLDLDAPDPLQFPRGMLLWNTRRSGFNVKEFRKNYFNSETFAGASLPTETDAWVTISGSRENGHAYFGRRAQRSVIVQALKTAVDTNTEIREEQTDFNLIACPGYPELIPNMIQLNNDRKQTAMVIGDPPFRVPTEGTPLTNWLTNTDLNRVENEDSLVTRDPYLAVFYPNVMGTDMSGIQHIMPASYAVLRMILQSDSQSAQWFAPAGIRRGKLDNITKLGYLTNTGEFFAVGVRQGVRDILYQNAVNPLMYTPQTGLINFGNKTRASSDSALDRINVARLICFMRSKLNRIVQSFLFEPNDKITRDEVKGVIDRFCNDLVTKRALYDYLVVCDESNNTPFTIDRNELHIDIAIEPVKAIEFIYIPIRIKNTGEIGSDNLTSSRTI